MFRVLFIFFFGKRDDVSKGTFWIVGVVVFLSRVFVSTKEMMMMATPTMMQHAPATTTPAAVEVRGIVFFFLFFKFFFFFIVVYVVVFRDWIFGYERRWLSLDDDFFSIGCTARVA